VFALPLPVRAALLGLAAGGRSTVPPAVLAFGPPIRSGPLTVLARPGARAVTALAVAGELVGDTLPVTPSRLDATGVGARVVTGALGGFGLAAREASGSSAAGRRTGAGATAVLAGVAGALLGARLGAAWRASAPFSADLPAALIEDAVVLTLAAVVAQS
jgi:uncharacterized membrane protein